MDRLVETLQELLVNDRIIGVVDALLLCLGITATVATIAPTLQTVAVRSRRSPTGLRIGGDRR